MYRFVSSMMIGAFLIAGQGCYQTVVRTGAQRSGPTHHKRQWFTIGGLMGLSEPAGHECGEQGLSYAESEMSGIDVLINLGVALAGAGVGAAVCHHERNGETTIDPVCVNGFATLAPFLLTSRTVRYGCAAGPGGIEYMPRAAAEAEPAEPAVPPAASAAAATVADPGPAR